jgi:predicted 3-demethylubiquinone-9 3-methyltransferase (glyoxalase superfamily)
MAKQVTPFLMFEGRAEEAMDFYVSLFPDSEVVSIARYGPGQPGTEGSVTHAVFTVAGQRVMCIDSAVRHGFTFTPSFSLFVDCESEEELDRAFAALAEGGAVMMPLGDYGFSRRFGWCSDRFGVSWQLNLP